MLGIALTRELRATVHTFVLVLHRQFKRGDRFCWGVLSVFGVGLTRSRLENVAYFELVAVAAVVFGVQHLLEEQAHLFANQCRAVPFDAVLTLYLLRLRLFDWATHISADTSPMPNVCWPSLPRKLMRMKLALSPLESRLSSSAWDWLPSFPKVYTAETISPS